MIHAFFQAYKSAYTEFDAKLIGQVYDFPMTFYSEQGETLSFDEAAFNANSERLLSMYQALGVSQVEFEVMSETVLSDVLSLVSILWYFRDSNGKDIYQATTRYVLKQSPAGLKIKAVFVVDETSKVAALRVG